MHDIIFLNMRNLLPDDLEKYAGEIGCDVAKWKKDFESDEVKKEVADDLAAGKGGGVRGTPTILINGRKYQGPRTAEGFNAAIEAEIKKADALIAAGTKLEDVFEKLSKDKT